MVYEYMTETTDEPKSLALNACWKKLGLEALDNFRGFSKQCDKVRSILVLIHKIPEEQFGGSRYTANSHCNAAELTL
jgi:hypothetical protein